jgi:type II secretory pathway pseudopilin PulG
MLLEVVMAIAIFSVAATGFVVALHSMGNAAQLVQSELRITRILESALDETLSLPVLEEGVTNTAVGQTGIELDTTVKILDQLENEDGQILQEMYSITVIAKWFENGQWQERSVDTWRYGRMYQP